MKGYVWNSKEHTKAMLDLYNSVQVVEGGDVVEDEPYYDDDAGDHNNDDRTYLE